MTEGRTPRWPSTVVVAVADATVFVALVIVLHVLRRDVDPLRDDLSDYAVGAYGLLMSAAFLALGLAFISLSVALGAGLPGGWRLRAGRWLLAIAGVAVACVAALPSPGTAEVVASLVTFIGFGVAAGLVSTSAWSGRRRSVTTALTGMYALVFLAMLFGPDAAHGGLMRIAVACIVAWVIVNAIWAAKPVEAG
jgi:hypothetical protein